jgi:hypothetical protein
MMKKTKALITIIINYLILIIVLSNFSCKSHNPNVGRIYYISGSGNDENPGSFRRPWKTLEKISTIKLSSGDMILLEGGGLFSGTIKLDSVCSGDTGRVITLASYGKGKAVIDAGISYGIYARHCSNVVIKNLVVRGAGRKEGNSADGITIEASDGIVLDSIEISGFQHSGLHVHICSNVKITNIHSFNNGFAGINISGTTIYDTAKYDNDNIYIGYSVADNNPGDPTITGNHSGNGILASSVKNGTIEYCEAFNNGWDMPWTGNGPVGIWIWDCTDFKIQHCISHDNKTNPVAKDGGGFDLDGGVSNSVIQYCISYNNQGAGYGLFEFGAAKPWKHNTVRYNISRNDGLLNEGSLAIWKMENAGSMSDCEIFNNTFFNDTLNGNAVSLVSNVDGMKFRNNIFVYSGSFIKPGQKIAGETFQANCYWNPSGKVTVAGYDNISAWAVHTSCETIGGKIAGQFADPGFSDPAPIKVSSPSAIARSGLSGFCLTAGSGLIDNGLDLKHDFGIDPGPCDITDAPVPQGIGFDAGAIEYLPAK